MDWGYYFLLLLTAVIGLVLTLVTLPGLWLIVGAAAVYAWLTGGVYLGMVPLVVLLAMAAGAEVAELVFGGRGAKKAGGTAWGVGGGLAGGLLGGLLLTPLIPMPVLGTMIGICLGTFLGAFGLELLMGKPVNHSLRIGVGALKGKFAGILGKVLIGMAMFVLVAVAGFPYPHHDRQTKAAAVTGPQSRPATVRR
jgi:uncharacterized protein YqgC (DUF456 family)